MLDQLLAKRLVAVGILTDGMLQRMRPPQQLLLAIYAPTFGASTTSTASVAYSKPVVSSRSCRATQREMLPQMLPSIAVVSARSVANRASLVYEILLGAQARFNIQISFENIIEYGM